MKPTKGRIVLYVVSDQEADAINAKRKANHACGDALSVPPPGAQKHEGNHVKAGDEFPGMIVNVFGDAPSSPCNLQVFLDGNDTHWATSRHNDPSKKPGTWHWPEREQVAAPVEAKAPENGTDGTHKTDEKTAPAPANDPDGKPVKKQTAKELAKLKEETGL